MRHPVEIPAGTSAGKQKPRLPSASHPPRRATAQRNHSLRARHKPASPANKKEEAFPARERRQVPASPNRSATAFHAQPARSAVRPRQPNRTMKVRKKTEPRRLPRPPSLHEMRDV